MNGDSQYLEPADTTDCPGVVVEAARPTSRSSQRETQRPRGGDRPVLWLSVSVLMQTEVLCKKGRREVVLVSRFLQKVRLSQAAWRFFFQLYISLGTWFSKSTQSSHFYDVFKDRSGVKRFIWYKRSCMMRLFLFTVSVQFCDEQWFSWSWIFFRTFWVEWLSTLSQNSGASCILFWGGTSGVLGLFSALGELRLMQAHTGSTPTELWWNLGRFQQNLIRSNS